MIILFKVSKIDFAYKYINYGGDIMIQFPFFPGTNLQDLNLDWLIRKIKELEERVKRLEDEINDNS